MARVNFYLREPSSPGETAIVLFFSYEGGRLKYDTGLSINPSDWNAKKQVTKKNVAFNLALEALSSTVRDLHAGFIARKEQVTSEALKAALEEEFKRGRAVNEKQKNAEATLNGLIDEYISSKKEQRTKGTMLRFSALKFHLSEYEDQHGQVLTKRIDHRFNDEFQNLLFRSGLQRNTVGKMVIGLKTVLNWAVDVGYQVPAAYKKFAIPKAPTNIISLTEDELYRMYRLENLGTDLAITRDLFCLSAFTGQRFSDITRIVPGMIKNNSWSIVDQKTKKSRIVPLEPEAIEILKRHKYCLTGLKSNQKANTGIKRVADLAKINEEVTVTRYYGTKADDETLPKWKLLTFHSAKKTYVTNFLRNGGRLEVLMQIVGNSERTLKPYIDLSNEERRAESKTVFNKVRRKGTKAIAA